MVAELGLPDFSTEDPINRLITGDWIFSYWNLYWNYTRILTYGFSWIYCDVMFTVMCCDVIFIIVLSTVYNELFLRNIYTPHTVMWLYLWCTVISTLTFTRSFTWNIYTDTLLYTYLDSTCLPDVLWCTSTRYCDVILWYFFSVLIYICCDVLW